jgi:hypothetical protein
MKYQYVTQIRYALEGGTWFQTHSFIFLVCTIDQVVVANLEISTKIIS